MSKTERLPFCNSCGSSDSKYRCPRCDAVSCSLACVKKHKVLNSCSGQRDKTKYINKSEYNEQNLLSDYRLLEETNRVVDNAQRDHKRKKQFFSSNVKRLRVEAAKKGVNLRLMPVSFQKRKENTSFFHFKSKVIMWRIKWEFPQANTHYVEAKQSENVLIKTLLEKYLDPTNADPVFKQKLRVYRDAEIGIFLQNHSTQQRSFFKIDTLVTVKDALKGKMVIEYPTFHVVLSRHFSEYPTDISGPIVKRARVESQNDSSTSESDDSSGPCLEDLGRVKKCEKETTNDTLEEKLEEINNHGKDEVDKVECVE
ncbi:box C/D snoRNA protein 1-like [Dendronephthya gigantea]|uniref:box C/D snoRNA protein 1-like n=1 Tax=Dendronephthya gigantea TaxID=151771 RepID=UPI00106D685F|nr:box C/D snoRNA protein 1-like [Dendronephthya gigantea]XP_028402148.1 box C/D snoRNA protein 1-like [Dendronephthya gigantea]XP_028402151.1 box C/D snoRNA protein 1-like [Dendronephthya gigantea]